MKLILSKQSILSLLSITMISLILLNNIVYQTGFQISQLLFNIVILLILFLYVLAIKKINFGFIYFYIFLFFGIFGILFINDNEAFNRNINYTLIVLSFFLVFYSSKYLKLYKSLFFLYTIIYGSLCITILIINDRGIINPNWIAMTMFYMVGFFVHNKKKVFIFIVLFFGLFTSFFIFESRGTSISYITAIISLIFLSFSHRFVRFSIFVIVSSIVIGYFVFLDFFVNNKELVEVLISQYSERGLGGREGVFIIGYEYLRDSNFLGYGIQMHGGFEDPSKGQAVHIHFGLLDLSLKFSIAIVGVFLIFLFFYIRKVDTIFLPFIAGILMTVFYYNGLAPSHLGLNLLLYLFLGYAYYNSKAKNILVTKNV